MTQYRSYTIAVCAALCIQLLCTYETRASGTMYCSGVTVTALEKDMKRQPVCDAARAVETILGGSLSGTHVFIVEMNPNAVKSFPKLATIWDSTSFEASIARLRQEKDMVYEGKRFKQHVVQMVPQRTNWRTAALAAHELMHELYSRLGVSTVDHRQHCDMFFGNMKYKQALELLAPAYGAGLLDIERILDEQRSQFAEFCTVLATP